MQAAAFDVEDEELDGYAGAGAETGSEDVGVDGSTVGRGIRVDEALEKRSDGPGVSKYVVGVVGLGDDKGREGSSKGETSSHFFFLFCVETRAYSGRNRLIFGPK